MILLVFSACNNQFDRAPGTLYEEIPDALRGNYFSVNKSKKDTFKFEINDRYIIGKNEGKNEDTLDIHKDFEFSSFDKYLFFSVIDDDKIFQISKVKMKKNYFEMSSIFAENPNDNKNLSEYFAYKQIPQIGGDTLTIYQMDENALLKYFKKHVKKKNTIKVYKEK